ncbi:MAG: hypothetical protein NPIRA04_21440 [Nitrospirales bacterium]|nr:MAG: hypothetical protein NPIRA04_21440 [Nitrospirales bacterium]
MALQLSPMMGTLAFPDRMGDDYPELLNAGRIVQGHSVSGTMSLNVVEAVDRDLADQPWRSSFHEALTRNQQFQRGLVTFAQDRQGNSTKPTDPTSLLKLQRPEWESTQFSVEAIKTLSGKRLSQEETDHYDYGFALIKTAASLIYTIQLCQQMNLDAATDSASHHQLLTRTCRRDHVTLTNRHIPREGY